MEGLRMDYKFTAILILMLTLLALFGGPAHSRNEYLNEYGARCGDFETRVEAEDRNNDYRHYSNNNNNYKYCCKFIIHAETFHMFTYLSLLYRSYVLVPGRRAVDKDSLPSAT